MQRIESALLGVLVIVIAVVIYPEWWWVTLAAFLLFDLSALGYLRSPSVGAALYNSVHNYAWPAVLGAVALLMSASSPELSTICGLAALAGAFHVAVDRALGYGLKRPDAFTHTHLGWIGRDRPRT
ncbi:MULTISPECIES: DUF4260 family protein [Microcella]|uniref:DUF4260 family protein n=1 Tax=Microcella TaxID=337004 RepID=UPI001FE5E6A1|nr:MULTISPECIES: DUF4260 family protein [Microcella]